MKCPNCDHLLHITERQNVEIDYCPSCRGVWLDKGELDKIIQFSNEQLSGASNNNHSNKDDSYKGQMHRDYNADSFPGKRQYPNQLGKKKTFLSDLFDFD